MIRQFARATARRLRRPARPTTTTRTLRAEPLESRVPLAADLSVFHNTLRPRDVNMDGGVTPQDALVLVNVLNEGVTLEGLLASRGGKGVEGEAQEFFKYDTNFDGHLTPLDAMNVINHLNSDGEGGTPAMEYIIRTFSANGSTPISDVWFGQQFQLRVYVRDVRNIPAREAGVFSAYTDINFDPSLVAPAGPIQHNDTPYGESPSGAISNGVINGAGSFSGSLSPVGNQEILLWSLMMTAGNKSGIVTFDGNPATEAADPGDAGQSPALDTGVYGQDRPVCPSASQFGCEGEVVHIDATLRVNMEGPAGNDVFTIDEDSIPTQLNVLANDIAFPPNTTFTITSVTQGDRGGVVVNNSTSVTYTPAADFAGQDTFHYTVTTNLGATETFTVTVNVMPKSDRPFFESVPFIPLVPPDTTRLIQGISIQDRDGAQSSVELSLQVANGQLSVAPEGVTVVGNNTSNLKLSGQLSQVNGLFQRTGVTYRPNAGFEGTETLTGVVRDPLSGLSDNFSRTFTVGDVIPSEIAGAVFVDADHDGHRDAGELGVAGVHILLTGTNIHNQVVNLTAITSETGAYLFANLLPGSYVLHEVQPIGMMDGGDRFGLGASADGNDRALIQLQSDGVSSHDNLFAEIGMDAHHSRAAFDLLASSAHSNRSVGLILGMDAEHRWSVLGGNAWSEYTDARLSVDRLFVANGRRHAIVTLTVRDAAGADRTVTLDSSTNPRLIYSEHNGTHVFGFRGGPAELLGGIQR